MDLFEVEGKLLFREYGIPCEEVRIADDEIPSDFPLVIKGQYLSGKRGKAGAIKVVHDQKQYSRAIQDINNISINGNYPSGIHIAPFVDVEKEYYLGITLDRKEKCYLLMFTKQGGIDVEDAAEKGFLHKAKITDEVFDRTCDSARIDEAEVRKIARKLWELVKESDCLTAEINPLGIRKDGTCFAMDAKVVIDDNSWYRQKERVRLLLERKTEKTVYEKEAEQYGLAFVNLNEHGNIGVIAGGAGIGMATVDSLNYYGMTPFNFCDLGGGVSAEKTYHAVRLLLDVEELEGILINVFGGINNCFEMAKGIVKALDEKPYDKKIVIKSRGFNQEEGWKLYDERNIAQVRYGTTDDAVIKLKNILEVKQ